MGKYSILKLTMRLIEFIYDEMKLELFASNLGIEHLLIDGDEYSKKFSLRAKSTHCFFLRGYRNLLLSFNLAYKTGHLSYQLNNHKDVLLSDSTIVIEYTQEYFE